MKKISALSFALFISLLNVNVFANCDKEEAKKVLNETFSESFKTSCKPLYTTYLNWENCSKQDAESTYIAKMITLAPKLFLDSENIQKINKAIPQCNLVNAITAEMEQFSPLVSYDNRGYYIGNCDELYAETIERIVSLHLK